MMHWHCVSATYLILHFLLPGFYGFTKVLVPAIYREFDDTPMPDVYANASFMEARNYSVFLYQRTDPTKANYIRNRGTEGAVYLRYIVDHYYTYPDVAVFVHAHSMDHTRIATEEHLGNIMGCLAPEARHQYASLNSKSLQVCRNPSAWPFPQWVEQCWRDALKIVLNDTKQIAAWIPPKKEITICSYLSQQFLLGREMMLMRPLIVYKELLKIVNEQDVCHEGEPDYDILYHSEPRLGPEHSDIDTTKFGTMEPSKWSEGKGQGHGAHIQGGMMEHLAHVIFGSHGLIGYDREKKTYCGAYYDKCTDFNQRQECPVELSQQMPS